MALNQINFVLFINFAIINQNQQLSRQKVAFKESIQ